MELSFIEMSELKKKFGNLLSYLHFDNHIRAENISDALVNSLLLDLLENNKLDEFMSFSYEKMATALFPGLQLIRRESNYVDEYYWSGIQYINIFLNYRIPLRTIILLCPLEEMVKKYDVFHEMNEIELCKSFLNNEYKNKSILKEFRNKRKASARQLSLLCNISISSIKHLEEDNNYLFSASANNIFSLSSALRMSPCFTRKKSAFTPITHSLLVDEDFASVLGEVVGKYFLKEKNPNLLIRFSRENKVNLNDTYLFIEGIPYLLINGKEKYIDDAIFQKMLDVAVDQYIEQNLKTNLVF